MSMHSRPQTSRSDRPAPSGAAPSARVASGSSAAAVPSGPVGVPRPEYPRPDLDRSRRPDRWLSLNGTWDFEGADAPARITVPFAWETEASGVARPWLDHGIYRRRTRVPAEWAASSIILCFGAVHHHAIVRVDGRMVGEHTGGHESFEVDLTGLIAPGQEVQLSVEVDAPADKRAIPHGKQRSIPRDDFDGVQFTPTSGIWQSVWLEARGTAYIRELSLRGDSLTGWDVAGRVAGRPAPGASVRLEVAGSGESVLLPIDEGGRVRGRLEPANPHLWSPEDPYLYSIDVTVGQGAAADQVSATAGLRRVEVRGEEFLLNGSRRDLRGVLDQGYWPGSGLTAPTAADLVDDLRLARDLGYTLVRKHLKFEEPLWLHEADRLGMLVWEEPPCPSRFSAAAAEGFEAQLPGMVARDGNHPSIVIWGLYNEEWGLDWDIPGSAERAAAAARAYDLLRGLDGTRPIVENSGWAHVRTDLVDWHYYEPHLGRWAAALADFAAGTRDTFPVRLGPELLVEKSFYGSADFPRTGVPILNSEYGEGATSLERAWHLRWQTQELRRHDRFAGYVYTELTDVEHECAGLVDAWRHPKDWGGLRPRDVNADTVLIVDLVPLEAGADIEPPAEDRVVDVRVSHHGASPVEGRVRAAWTPAGTPMGAMEAHVGRTGAGDTAGDVPADAAGAVSGAEVEAAPFRVSDPVGVAVPAHPGAGRLMIWLEDADGAVLARTFLDAAEVERGR